MEAKKLRIGNYLNFNGKLDKVKKIPLLKSQNKNTLGINLNNEWLVKFGFEKEEDHFVKVLGYDDGEFNIYYIDNEYYFICRGNMYIEIRIEYIHELQNLFFALTEDELELKHKL